MLTNCGKQTSVKLKLRKIWLNIEIMFAEYRRSYRDLVLVKYKNRRVLAKAFTSLSVTDQTQTEK